MLKKVAVIVAFMLLVLIATYSEFSYIGKKQVVFSKNYSQGGFFTSNISDVGALYSSKGYSFSLSSDNLEFIDSLNAKEVYSSKIQDVENTYYYSNKIKTYQIINGKRVNVHVAKTNNKIVVGIPIIYYGY